MLVLMGLFYLIIFQIKMENGIILSFKKEQLSVFDEFQKNIEWFKEELEKTQINNVTDMQFATWFLKRIQITAKEIESFRKGMKDPITALGKKIDQKAKEYSDPLDLIKKKLTTMQVDYQRKLDEEKRRLEEEERKKLEEKKQVVWNDEEIVDIVEKKSNENVEKINQEYDLSKQKWYYEDFEIESVDMFNVHRKYLRIKPLSIEADVMMIKKDLKAWYEIPFIKYKKVWKVK